MLCQQMTGFQYNRGKKGFALWTLHCTHPLLQQSFGTNMRIPGNGKATNGLRVMSGESMP